MINIYLSSSCARGAGVLDAVERLSEITTNIELSGGAGFEDHLLDGLLRLKKQKGINFLIHGFFPPPKERFVLNFANTGMRTREFIRESVRFARALGVGYYSVHAGFKKDFDFKDELLIETGSGIRYGIDGIMENIKWFRNEFPDMRLAVENLFPNGGNGECCFLMKENDIHSFLGQTEDLSLLLDLGHLQISAEFFGFEFKAAAEGILRRWGGRIEEIHLSENRGRFDDHNLLNEESPQIAILAQHAETVIKNKINLVIEARNASFEGLRNCYLLVADRVYHQEVKN